MEVSSSTATAGTSASSFGQDFNNDDDDDEQNQPVSSDVDVGVESGAQNLPLEIDGNDSHLGASCAEVAQPLHYGPVVCPDFYQDASLSSYGKDIPDPRGVHGSCGLHNLGNTCFMNSGLQSLMSCSPLIKFFSENFILDDSSRNTLTGHFYILLCKMWSGQFSVVHPKKFKEFLGLYHSQFEDYRQHDCQEFLAFLLDTLHEQMNEAFHPNNYLPLSSSSSSSMACSAEPPAPPPSSPGISSASFVITASAVNSVVLPSAASPITVSCSETELSKCLGDSHHKQRDNQYNLVVDNFNNRTEFSQHHRRDDKQKSSVSSGFLGETTTEICGDGGLVESSEFDSVNKSSSDSSGSSGGGCGNTSSSSSNVITNSTKPCEFGNDAFGAGERSIKVTSSKLIVDSDGDEMSSNVFKNRPDNYEEDDDSDLISSSGGLSLKRFTSRSNLDDVSSSDIGFVVKPSLKRVSTDTTGVSASGLTFSSEDSNQSSLSVHSTDSEQSNTFKRLKIESSSSLDLLSSSSSSSVSLINSNNNSNNYNVVSGLKDFIVTSSSDCKSDHQKLKKGGGEKIKMGKGKSDEFVVSSNLNSLGSRNNAEIQVSEHLLTSSSLNLPEGSSLSHESRRHEDPMEESESSSTSPPLPPPSSSSSSSSDMKEIAKGQLQRLHSLEEFYKKETKTLNTNVLVADDSDMNEISCDSEKFAKMDNRRHRLNSREINLLQEVFDEEDNGKVDKVLIGQQLGVKDVNLYSQTLHHHHNLASTSSTSSSLVDDIKSGNKPISTTSLNSTVVLNNSYDENNDHALSSCHQTALSISKLHQCDSSHSGSKDLSLANNVNIVAVDFGRSKLDEAEKNVQMQAYSKFNTTPPKSNLRIDLTDNPTAISGMDNVDEVDEESSDDEEMEKRGSSPPPHHHHHIAGVASSSSSMESECSSVPNCLRSCLPSEVSMANQAWQEYKSRNNSIVVSTFQGQFRSTVVCSECSHVSVTYEPFMYLSLPIPHAMEQQLCVTFISQGKLPMRYLLNMMKTDKIGACKKKLKEMIGLSSCDLVMAEVLDSHVSRILDDNILLKYVNIFNRKIYAFEMATPATSNDSNENADHHHILLNNSDVDNDAHHHHHRYNDDGRYNNIIQDDLCLVSTSRAADDSSSGLGLHHPYNRTEGGLHASNESLDSIHVNTPSSRGTMDLGFSDSEMCDIDNNATAANLSFSSHHHDHQQQDFKLSSSVFREGEDEDNDVCSGSVGVFRRLSGDGDDDNNDVCQSTTPDVRICNSSSSSSSNNNPWLRGGKNDLTSSSTLPESDALCLSWKIVQDKDGSDDCDETASTVTTVVGSSSSVCGDDNIVAAAPCSSSLSSFYSSTMTATTTKFWVDQPGGKDNVTDNSVLSPVENSTIVDDDDDYDNVGANVNLSNNMKKDHGETSRSLDDCIDIDSNGAGSESVSESGLGFGSDPMMTSTTTKGAKSHDHHHQLHHHAVVSSLMGEERLKEEEAERPGSYFMQSPGPGLHGLDSVCHTADEQPMTEINPDADAATTTACLTDNWTTTFDLDGHPNVDSLPPAPVLSPLPCSDVASDKMEDKSVPVVSPCDPWKSCAICLEDMPLSQLITHVNCDGVFCQGCLDMSVKHTADVSFFCCPICLQPANVCEDFVSLPTSEMARLQARMLTMCLAFRHLVVDNTGTSSLQLVGHPTVIEMTSVMAGDDLYTMMDTLIGGRPYLTYSVLLTDGQGLNCSRCPYTAHCTGCKIAREGEIILRPSDNLTVHSCQTLSVEEVSEMQFEYDDPSMASLRSSEPTTIMDCFGAFTQSEILDEHNPWYCPRCERNQCAKKTMTVWRYPDNLIIHLKRFVYQDLSSTKVDTKVVFPHRNMDVRGFLSGPSSPGLTYDLYSVICHFGGASAGHYTSFALHPLTSQWYYYNDETVSLQSPQDNEYSSGYVLFYQRQGTSVEITPPQYSASMEEDIIPAQVSTTTTTNSTSSTFHQAFTTTTTSNNNSSNINSSGDNNSMALVLFVPPTSTTTNSSSSFDDNINTKNTMTVVSNSSSSSSNSYNQDDNRGKDNNFDKNSNIDDVKDVVDEEEEDDDDYDCERRCSPSSEYGSLSVHFGSVLPDTDADFNIDDNNSNISISNGNEARSEEVSSNLTTTTTDNDDMLLLSENNDVMFGAADGASGGGRSAGHQSLLHHHRVSGSGGAVDRSPASAEPDSSTSYDVYCDEIGF